MSGDPAINTLPVLEKQWPITVHYLQKSSIITLLIWSQGTQNTEENREPNSSELDFIGKMDKSIIKISEHH